jgi:beta-galactosidase
VRLEGGGLRFTGTPNHDVPLWSGAVHYFRAPRSEWRAQLEAARDLGLTAIETYVPWQVHELAAGRFDFGQHDEDLDVGAFIDLVGELGLYAIVRPGPHINSEMTYFGLPERIIYDRACQARSPRQAPVVQGFPPRMFPVPSYASETFLHETQRWYDAVGAELASRIYPRGPIVLLQVDNEAAFYFRDSPYDQDYHPDAVALYRRFVKERHPSASELQRVYGDVDVETLEPPTSFDVCGDDDGGDASKLGRHLDFAAFREWMITHAITRMKAQMATAGLTGVPTIHNLPLGELAAPLSLPALEEVVDAVGLDYYHARRELPTIKRRTLYLVGSSRLPISPEMGVGAPFWFTPLTHDDSLHCAMVTLAFGLRGMNLYMAVDRDRWYGAPVDASGVGRTSAAAWRALMLGLRRMEFHRLERQVAVGLVVPREYLRMARMTHAFGLVSPVWLEAAGGTAVDGASDENLGMEVPIQVAFYRQIERWMAALDQSNVPYVLVDSDVAPERVASLEVLICPSFEITSPSRWRLLTTFEGEVVFGPSLPRVDDTMRARPFELPARARRFEDGDEVGTLASVLQAHPSWISPCSAPGCEVTVHHDAEGQLKAVFLIHAGEAKVETVLTGLALPDGMLLCDVITDRMHPVKDGAARLSVGPQRCVLLEVRAPGVTAPSDDEDDGADPRDVR